MSGLYRRLLGNAFDSLPTTLRDFHDVVYEGLVLPDSPIG
jgi:hypothetical protein